MSLYSILISSINVFFNMPRLNNTFVDNPLFTWRKAFGAGGHQRREDVVFNTDMGKYAEPTLKFSVKEADIRVMAAPHEKKWVEFEV
jgi:hypothetical protein